MLALHRSLCHDNPLTQILQQRPQRTLCCFQRELLAFQIVKERLLFYQQRSYSITTSTFCTIIFQSLYSILPAISTLKEDHWWPESYAGDLTVSTCLKGYFITFLKLVHKNLQSK